MATYSEQLQRIYHEYTETHGGIPATLREAVEWGVEQGRIVMPNIDPLESVIGDMGRALRAEYGTDPLGRRYRRNHAARVTRDGVQFTFWAEMETAPREHMLKSFADRRNQIVGECVQLATDVSAYNEFNRNVQPPIQMVLDFTQDVEELQAVASDEASIH
jgi:hypothetical protein